jgi:hypothetical protein
VCIILVCVQVAGLPYQLAAIFSGCPDQAAKLVYLRDILVPDHHVVPPTAAKHVAWDAVASGGGEAVQRNPLTARYLAALLTKELAERCELLK